MRNFMNLTKTSKSDKDRLSFLFFRGPLSKVKNEQTNNVWTLQLMSLVECRCVLLWLSPHHPPLIEMFTAFSIAIIKILQEGDDSVGFRLNLKIYDVARRQLAEVLSFVDGCNLVWRFSPTWLSSPWGREGERRNLQGRRNRETSASNYSRLCSFFAFAFFHHFTICRTRVCLNFTHFFLLLLLIALVFIALCNSF